MPGPLSDQEEAVALLAAACHICHLKACQISSRGGWLLCHPDQLLVEPQADDTDDQA